MDFGQIRSSVEKWIDEELDHHTLLCRRDPLAQILMDAGEKIVLLDENPTAENIARLIFRKARELALPVVKVQVWETPKCCASYVD